MKNVKLFGEDVAYIRRLNGGCGFLGTRAVAQNGYLSVYGSQASSMQLHTFMLCFIAVALCALLSILTPPF